MILTLPESKPVSYRGQVLNKYLIASIWNGANRIFSKDRTEL